MSEHICQLSGSPRSTQTRTRGLLMPPLLTPQAAQENERFQCGGSPMSRFDEVSCPASVAKLFLMSTQPTVFRLVIAGPYWEFSA